MVVLLARIMVVLHSGHKVCLVLLHSWNKVCLVWLSTAVYGSLISGHSISQSGEHCHLSMLMENFFAGFFFSLREIRLNWSSLASEAPIEAVWWVELLSTDFGANL